jgi:uncharacterized Tic20 family protein
MENPAQPAVSSDDRLWGALAHLGALSMYLTGIGWIAGPLIVWLCKRDTSRFADAQGKEALNFAISVAIWVGIACIPCITVVYIFLLPFVLSAIGVFHLICVIIAGVKAYDGISFHYPLTFRFIK